MPPVLAVEVGSRDEPTAHLREKARWYLAVGAAVVWLVFPSEREVQVITASTESRHRMGERLPPDARVPDLAPCVDDIFLQISGRGG